MPLPVPLDRLARSEELLRNGATNGPASLPVQNPTNSFWLKSAPDANPLADEGSKGSLTPDTDVCIIGSGISGISAAYHLSKLSRGSQGPLNVVVLEAREFCSGATGRNGGHITPAIFFDFIERSERHGEEEALKMIAFEQRNAQFLLDLINDGAWATDIDLVNGGHAKLISSEKERAKCLADFEAAKAAGFDASSVQWLSEDEAMARFGTQYEVVTYDSWNVWPNKLVTKLFNLARSSEESISTKETTWLPSMFRPQPPKDSFVAVLHTHTPATEISPSESARRWQITTSRGNITCDYIIHTTNGYTSHLLPHLTGPAGIIPVRAQVMATRAAVPLEKLTTTAWSANEGFEYWFPRPKRDDDNDKKPLVIIGGGREIPDGHELYLTDDSTLNPEIANGLRKFLPAVFPGRFERSREPEMEWTGIIGYTAYGQPITGPVLDPHGLTKESFNGQFISAGFSGHGMTRAPLCAEIVARMIWHDMKRSQGEHFEVPSWMPKAYLSGYQPGQRN